MVRHLAAGTNADRRDAQDLLHREEGISAPLRANGLHPSRATVNTSEQRLPRATLAACVIAAILPK